MTSATRTKRRYPGQRPLRIAIRTLHIAAAVMVLGAVVFSGDPGSWTYILVFSGLGIVADDLYRYGLDWLRYLQGWCVLIKVGLLIVGTLHPPVLGTCLWTALVIGALISHAPGEIRQYAFWGPPGPCATRKSTPCDEVRSDDLAPPA